SVPPYIRCAHQSAPLHQLSPSEFPYRSGIPITVPPYIRYCRQSAPLCSKYPFPSYFLIRVPLYIIFPIRLPVSITCAHQNDPFHSMCPFVSLNITCAHQSAP
ncbi:unnamed protein product, partial [Staurois parvus]